MKLKRKTMQRHEWKGIEEKSFCAMPVNNELFSGKAGLLRMESVERPFFISDNGRRVQITGRGYTWLQLAPEKEHFWATVMFDAEGRLFEQYFDITLENHIPEEGDAWFTDLILDVVVNGRNEIETLDGEELKSALGAGEITQAQYALAVSAQKKLLIFLSRHQREWTDMCVRLREDMLPGLC